MNCLASMATSFSIPTVTPEQQAEADTFDAMQRENRHIERMRRAGIPNEYRSASLSTCCAEVQRYAENFGTDTTRGLLLTGQFGRGKTYQACALLMATAKLCPVMFSTMQGILDEIKACFTGTENQTEVILRYSNVRVLCLDDLGKENATEWAAPIIYEIINARYSKGKPTIITTNYNSDALAAHFAKYADAETAGAILSRIGGMCELVCIEGADRRIAAALKG